MNVVRAGNSVMLTCNVTGFPIPAITWFQNGSAIDSGDNIATTVQPLTRRISSTLTISMAMRDDSGVYHCNISSPNFINVISEEVLVLVQGV